MKRQRSSKSADQRSSPFRHLAKVKTGISGFDEITEGGLPKGRSTLLCGGPGCGKTLFAMEFLVRGATEFDEPGIFVSFEESEKELTENVRSLGFVIPDLVRKKKILVEHILIDPSQIEETGEYNLEGLFVRIGHAIDSIGAKRVVLDTIEALFSQLKNEMIIRSELVRLFLFLKTKGVTAIVTGEKGESSLTRNGLEEYVSDCVIFLDHRAHDQLSTRRLRVIKYRGAVHGTNEYPFLIGEMGISVFPITSMGLYHSAHNQRVSSGIVRLDEMLDGSGYYSGSTVIVTGPAGSGKTSIASHFADEICRHSLRCLYFSFEESPSQIVRNMRSIGIDLGKWIEKGSLQINATRPSYYGLEMHLTQSVKLIGEFKPAAVVVDPLTDLGSIGTDIEVKLMLSRMIDFLKNNDITAIFTGLRGSGEPVGSGESGISSLIDTWIALNIVHSAGEGHRTISIVKSRGMNHSNQIRQFYLTDNGVKIESVYQAELQGERAKTAEQSRSQSMRSRQKRKNNSLFRGERL